MAKKPIGRPSKFSPAYCNEVIQFMGEGFSLTAFAGEIGVARSTVNLWMVEHPEFSDAVKIGQAKRTGVLERGLLSGESGPRVTAHIFALKNADPDGWRDRHEYDHTSSDGSMTPKPALDVSRLSSAALAEIVAVSEAESGEADCG